jgi:hypothetical protein
VKILLDENTILVKGSIPGYDGSDVIIKPTRKKYIPKEILTKQETKSEKLDQEAETKKVEKDVKTDQVKQEAKSNTGPFG